MIKQEEIPTNYNSREMISQIFLSYLEIKLSQESFAEMVDGAEFQGIINYSPNLNQIAFQDLVNLSLQFMCVPIDKVLRDFSEFYKNMQSKNSSFI